MSMPCCYTKDGFDYCEARRLPDLPMCQRHLLRTFRDALVDGVLPADVFGALVRQTQAYIELGQTARRFEEGRFWTERKRLQEEREADRERMRKERLLWSVVYYVQLTQNRIKIGWTTNLEKRLQAFRSTEGDLLATEPGDNITETERHRQFAHLRIGRSEDFTAGPDLLDHIARLAGQDT